MGAVCVCVRVCVCVYVSLAYRARDGIWVKSFLCWCGWCWGLSAVVLLSRVWAWVARLGSSHLPERTWGQRGGGEVSRAIFCKNH